MPWVFDVGGSERFKAASGRPYFSNDCRAEPPTFWWTPSGPSLAAIFRPFWPRSPPNGWLPQPDGIRHRNSEREYLASVFPRQSPSSLILWSINAEAGSTG